MNLPTEWIVDSSITEKARFMLRRHSPEYVSRYLGMHIEQVRRTAKNMTRSSRRGRPPKGGSA